jgi:hypothetical protein
MLMGDVQELFFMVWTGNGCVDQAQKNAPVARSAFIEFGAF